MADPIRVLGCFSGIGGLELAVSSGLARVGRDHRLVGLVEGEAFGCACLVAAMERGDLAPAPVWLGDIREFPAAAFRGAVDLVCAGFPCQDISHAGRGDGITGARSGLFFDCGRLAREVGAEYLFLENVAALNVRGLDAVLGTLSDGGWSAEWLHLRASDVGAPHRRERWFCLAHRDEQLHDRSRDAGARGRGEPTDDGERVADAGDVSGEVPSAGSPDRAGGGVSPGAGRDGDVPRWPPGPDDAEGWRRVIAARPDLAPALAHTVRVLRSGDEQQPLRGRGRVREVCDEDVAYRDRSRLDRRTQRDEQPPRGEQTQPGDDADRRGAAGACERGQGGDDGEAQPALRRVAHGLQDSLDRALLYRTDRLRALGNAVVPSQGAEAFAELWRRIHGDDPCLT